MSVSLRYLALAASVTLLAACNRPQPEAPKPAAATAVAPARPATPALRPVTPAAADTLSVAAVLHTQLPDSAAVYVRVPTLWGLLGAPNGTTLDRATNSAPYVNALQNIREGMGTNLAPLLPAEAQAAFRLLMVHARSPIELAALPAGDPQNPMPGLLGTLRVDIADVQALNTLLGALADSHPMLELSVPLSPDAAGILSLAGQPLHVEFDQGESRVWLALGNTPDLATRLRAQLKSNPAHVMHGLERDIDASGQGLFMWADPGRLADIARAAGDTQQAAQLAMLKMSGVTGMAAGVGSANGIQHVKVALDMPRSGFRALVPGMQHLPKVRAAGTPRAVVMLALPTAQDFAAIESTVTMNMDQDDLQGYREFKARFTERVGVPPEGILDIVGQDLTLLWDEAGNYAALRLKDPRRFQQMIDNLAKQFELRYEQRQINGRTYHHLVVPSLEQPADTPDDATDPGTRLVARVMGTPAHLYWVEEQDYLLLDSLPQALIDRGYVGERVAVDEWLRNTQRLDAQGALLLASGRTEDLPQLMYRFDLELLNWLGDVTQTEVDLFAMPTAREAGLPREGSISLKMTSSDTRFGVQLDFESNPMEVLFAGGGSGAVMAGIAAAIAIPAYQSYIDEARLAQVRSAHEAALHLQSMVRDFHAGQQRYPTADDVEATDLSSLQSDDWELTLSPDDGSVTVIFLKGEFTGESLVLFPVDGDPDLWQCESSLAEKYLPEGCR